MHQRQLARAQLKVLVVVTLGRLFARGGHLGETREAAMKLRGLLGEQGAVRLVLLRQEVRVFLLLMLEVANCLREVLMRLLHKANHLTLLEGGRDRVAKVDPLRKVNGHPIPIHA